MQTMTRTTRAGWPAFAGLLVMLTGCQQPIDPAAQLPPVARAKPGPVDPDGTYQGQLISKGAVASGAFGCGSIDSLPLTIRDRKLRLVLAQPEIPYRTRIVFDVTISDDGTFASPSEETYMRGSVSDGHLQGQVVGDACSFSLEADRNGSW